MTVVAAMLLEDFVLIASDSKETQVGLKTVACKVRSVSSLPIAWGGAGEVSVIDGFERWITAYKPAKQMTWESYMKEATKTLNALNREKKKSIHESGSAPKSEDLGKILIAGYIAGMPNILEVTDRGESYLHGERRFAAIGSGENHFKIAKVTVESFMRTFAKQPLTYDETKFWFLVDIASRTDPNSGLPLQWMKVTPQGVLRKGLPNLQAPSEQKTS